MLYPFTTACTRMSDPRPVLLPPTLVTPYGNEYVRETRLVSDSNTSDIRQHLIYP